MTGHIYFIAFFHLLSLETNLTGSTGWKGSFFPARMAGKKFHPLPASLFATPAKPRSKSLSSIVYSGKAAFHKIVERFYRRRRWNVCGGLRPAQTSLSIHPVNPVNPV
jgi:hypothetical protein